MTDMPEDLWVLPQSKVSGICTWTRHRGAATDGSKYIRADLVPLERLCKWACESGYSTGHADNMEELLDELLPQFDAALDATLSKPNRVDVKGLKKPVQGPHSLRLIEEGWNECLDHLAEQGYLRTPQEPPITPEEARKAIDALKKVEWSDFEDVSYFLTVYYKTIRKSLEHFAGKDCGE